MVLTTEHQFHTLEAKKVDHAEDEQNIQQRFQAMGENQELLAKIIQLFPYQIRVYAPDGTAILVNDAAYDEYKIPRTENIVGEYNILKDPVMVELGLIESIQRVFSGETVYKQELKAPLQSFKKIYKLDNYEIDAMYQDVTAFPIKNAEGKVAYVVVIIITRKIFRGKECILKAIEYLKDNWHLKFNIGELAQVANLSPCHFSRRFKQEVGITPYNYYLNLKIGKIKEKLADPNLSIAQAFSACGVDYHGHLATVFKEKVGVTPSKYRQLLKNNKSPQ